MEENQLDQLSRLMGVVDEAYKIYSEMSQENKVAKAAIDFMDVVLLDMNEEEQFKYKSEFLGNLLIKISEISSE